MTSRAVSEARHARQASGPRLDLPRGVAEGVGGAIFKLNLKDDQVRMEGHSGAGGTVCVRPGSKEGTGGEETLKGGVAHVERGQIRSGQTARGLQMGPKRFGKTRKV